MKVLDTSVFVHGPDRSFDDAAVVREVVEEVGSQGAQRALRLADPEVVSPQSRFLNQVRCRASDLNYSFSKADVASAATALGRSAQLVSDDKPLLSMCERLDIDAQGYTVSLRSRD